MKLSLTLYQLQKQMRVQQQNRKMAKSVSKTTPYCSTNSH